MKLIKILLVLFCLPVTIVYSQEKNQSHYTKTPTGYMMVLRQGNSLQEELEKLAIKENIPSATISGMGFVNATFGFFNAKERRYDTKDLKGVELANLIGSIAWKEGKPSLHMHGVVTDSSSHTYGGHLMSAEVGTGSVEITIIVHDKELERVFDTTLGGNVLKIE